MLPFQAFSRDRAIPKDKPFRVYGVLGDAHLQTRIVQSLIGWTMDEDSHDFNMDSLDGESTSVSELLARCGNLPFLAERRIVVLHRAERLENIGRAAEKAEGKSKGPSAAKRLADGLAALPETTVLILRRSPETPEAGARKETPRLINAAVDKVIEGDGKTKGIGLIFDCLVGAKSAGLAVAAVQSEATERGIALGPGAAEFLISRAGTDIARALNELEKCALRAGGAPVTRAVIEEMTPRQPSETIFDLVDALATKRHAQALGLMHELLGSGEPAELVMSLISKHFRQLIQARAILDARLTLDANLARRIPPELAEQLPPGRDNVPNLMIGQGWRGPKLAGQARLFSAEQLMDALEAALAVDLALKGIEGDGGAESKATPKLLLDLFIAKLA